MEQWKRPEGRLIEQALHHAGLSRRGLSRQLGDHPTSEQIGQIINGYRIPAKGLRIPVVGTAALVARIAEFLKITPDAMENADRSDVATSMRESADQATVSVPPAEQSSTDQILDEVRALRTEVAQLKQQVEDRPENPKTKSANTRTRRTDRSGTSTPP